jgi:Protein of unknown function (DUF2637)
MTTQTEITQKNHLRAVRFFWVLLIGATLVSLTGNIIHAVLPYIPHVVIQIGAAAVPPVALLAAVHGVALAVRAGASGRIYCWAVGAVAAIGAGAFVLSFLALRDLMRTVGYSDTTAWIFPVLIDMAIAVSTLMLVALGDKPARRIRTVTTSANTQTPTMQRLIQRPARGAKDQVRGFAPGGARVPTSASVQPNLAHTVHASAQTEATPVDAEVAQFDADLASELIASGVTTQPAVTVIAVLEAHRNGASINAAAQASGINYRTAQRIVEGAAEHRHRQLVAVG